VLGRRAALGGDNAFGLLDPIVFFRDDILLGQKQKADKADFGQRRLQSAQSMMASSFSLLEKAAKNTIAELRGENWRDCIANLRELPCRWPKENIIVRKCLQPCAFSGGHCAWNVRMQMRAASTLRPASNDCFGGKAWVESVNAAKMISLAVIKNHVTQQRFSFVFAWLMICNAPQRAAQGSFACNEVIIWFRMDKLPAKTCPANKIENQAS
jgi:hypothetical protein